jgi:hypothetical protein
LESGIILATVPNGTDKRNPLPQSREAKGNCGGENWGDSKMEALWNLIFGCWHRRTSLPFTLRDPRFGDVKPGSTRASSRRNSDTLGTYIVCLDCGKEIPYNWEEMRTEKKPQRVREHEHEEERAAAHGLSRVV